MNNLITKFATTALLTAFLGCTKQTSSLPSTPRPEWNNEAYVQAVQTYHTIHNPQTQTKTHQIPNPQALFPPNILWSSVDTILPPVTTAPPTTCSASLTNHPACYNADHTDYNSLKMQISEARMLYTNAHTKWEGSQASNYTAQITALTTQTHRQETMITHLREGNQRLQREYNQLTQTYTEKTKELLTQTQRLGIQLADYQKQEQAAQGEQRKLETESILIQTLLGTKRYVIPGSPLVTGTIKNNHLENVVTHHFALPRVALTLDLFDETLTQLGALGYKPETSVGAFSNWVHQAGLPGKAFPGANTNPLQYDRGTHLCKEFALSLNGPFPGLVVYTNKAGIHFIGTEDAVTKWRTSK